MNRFVVIALFGFVACAAAAPCHQRCGAYGQMPPSVEDEIAMASEALLEHGCPEEHLDEALGYLYEFAQGHCKDPSTLKEEERRPAMHECVKAFVDAFHAEHPDLPVERCYHVEEEERCGAYEIEEEEPEERCGGHDDEEEEEPEERCGGYGEEEEEEPEERCGGYDIEEGCSEEDIVDMATEALLSHGCPEEHLEEALGYLHEFAQEHCPDPNTLKKEECHGAVHKCVKAFVDAFHAEHPDLPVERCYHVEEEERCGAYEIEEEEPEERCGGHDDEEEEEPEERCGGYGEEEEEEEEPEERCGGHHDEEEEEPEERCGTYEIEERCGGHDDEEEEEPEERCGGHDN